MQRLTLFRALLIFGILQGASNAGYWLLSITDKHMISMAAAVFFENLCGGMGTAAFVALLMTLCNKSFSATQFALLSALSAVGAFTLARLPAGLWKPTAGQRFISSLSWLPCRDFIAAGLSSDAGIYPADRTLYAAHRISPRLPFCVTSVNGGLRCAGTLACGADY
jgi:hypothetical protein